MTARAKTKTGGRRQPVPAAQPKPQPTRAELLEKIGVVLDAVDAVMKKPHGAIEWTYACRGPLHKHRETIDGLIRQLDALENPDRAYDGPTAEAAIAAEFGAKPGEVPSWARPGRFVVWVGPVPVLCCWGGFADSSSVQAIDRTKPWIIQNEAWRSTSTQEVPARPSTPAEYFRMALEAHSKARDFKLHELTPSGQDAADTAADEAGREWLAGVLKAGPMNAIELPTRLTEIQQRLF